MTSSLIVVEPCPNVQAGLPECSGGGSRDQTSRHGERSRTAQYAAAADPRIVSDRIAKT